MTAKEFVLHSYHNAVIDIDKTREATELFTVVTENRRIALSSTRFSEEDAWQDAKERLVFRRELTGGLRG